MLGKKPALHSWPRLEISPGLDREEPGLHPQVPRQARVPLDPTSWVSREKSFPHLWKHKLDWSLPASSLGEAQGGGLCVDPRRELLYLIQQVNWGT